MRITTEKRLSQMQCGLPDTNPAQLADCWPTGFRNVSIWRGFELRTPTLEPHGETCQVELYDARYLTPVTRPTTANTPITAAKTTWAVMELETRESNPMPTTGTELPA